MQNTFSSNDSAKLGGSKIILHKRLNFVFDEPDFLLSISIVLSLLVISVLKKVTAVKVV